MFNSMLNKMSLIMISFLTIFLCIWTAHTINAAEPIRLEVVFSVTLDTPWGQGAAFFKKIVEQETEGAIKVALLHSSQMGSGKDNVEAVQLGTIAMAIASTPIVIVNPMQEIFDLPYIFISYDHAYRVLDGPIGQEIAKEMEKKNLKFLGYGEDGFRVVTNNVRPIRKPEDFKNIMIRTPESAVRAETFRILGANPVVMPWADVYTGLSQGTIDGQENPIVYAWTKSFYDVQKYISVTNHVYSPTSWVINMDKWKSLSDKQQEIILRAAKKGQILNRKVNLEQSIELRRKLEATKAKVNDIDDPLKFQEATKPIWKLVTQRLGPIADEYIKRIEREAR